MKRLTTITTVFAMLAIFAMPALASSGDDKDALKQRFEKRYPELKAAKAAGKIGETFGGFVEAVNGQALDDAMQQLVSDENADRHSLYKLIAAEEKTDEQTVARRAGKRNFEKARAGEYLKGDDGVWKKR